MPQYRTLPRLGTRLVGVLGFLLLPAVVVAQERVEVRTIDGQVRGVVREAGSLEPVGYALVQLPGLNLRMFTSPGGQFVLPGLSPGTYRVEVRQIGFAPLAADLVVADAIDQGAPLALLTLTRQSLVLPEVVDTAMVCEDPRLATADAAARAILDQLVTNAERLLALEREYPVHARFERLTAGLVGLDSARWFVRDTLSTRSEDIAGYERGRVLRTGSRAAIRYFTTSDIARPAFREHHCLWVSGMEEVAGEPMIRIDFAPARRVRSADWEGSLFLDPVTALLRRSEARLVNIPRNAGGVRSSTCEVTYMEIEPTLVHEQAANCYTVLSMGAAPVRQESWRLLGWEFTGRRPGG